MRYVRFLKTPRIIDGDHASKAHISALVTITSDLGDSFLPCDVTLSAELWSETNAKGRADLSRTINWASHMRCVPVNIPLGRDCIAWPARIRVGSTVNSKTDHFDMIMVKDRCEDSAAILSAWSAVIDPRNGGEEAEKQIQRRFNSLKNETIIICEETGESIARHIWDAGLTTSVHMEKLVSIQTDEKASKPLYSVFKPKIRVLELGTGCGMVGITLAKNVPNAQLTITDLPEAKAIATLNISKNFPSGSSDIQFHTLEWGKPLDTFVSDQKFDLVMASDCTYNSDSSPALVQTIAQLVQHSPKAAVIISMKVRHSSEDFFFTVMSDAGFSRERRLELPLRGDDATDEEVIQVHLFRAEHLSRMRFFINQRIEITNRKRKREEV